ncbi:MAG: hypothetical protein ACR2RF_24945 [Geminicoccaceae bacterium]
MNRERPQPVKIDEMCVFEEDPWPHEVLKQAAVYGSYKRESYRDGTVEWTFEEEAFLRALYEYQEKGPDQ